MASINAKFFQTTSYADLHYKVRSIETAINLMGSKSSHFYSSDYDAVRDTTVELIGTAYPYRHYDIPTLGTLRKWGVINVVDVEITKLYGIDEYYGFEAVPDMTEEIYNILPGQVQDMFEIQERKRYIYAFNNEALREMRIFHNKMADLLASFNYLD